MPPELDPIVTSTHTPFDLVEHAQRAWEAGAWPVVIGYGLMLLIALSRQFGAMKRFPKRYVPLLAVILATLGAVGTGLVQRIAPMSVVSNALITAFTAIGAWEAGGARIFDLAKSAVKIMWRKVVYATLVVAFFAVIVSFYLSRKKALGLAAIALLESAHRPNIQKHLDSVEELKKDLATNAEAIKRAEFEVEKARLDLTQTYSSVGLSADEVAARLASLRL